VINHLGPLDRSQLGPARRAQQPDTTARVLAQESAEFWFNERLNLAPGSDHLHDNQFMGADRWAEWIDASNDVGNALNTRLLRAMGRALETSKVPSYVYLSQVTSSWFANDPTFRRAVTGVEHQLEAVRGAFDARTIRYQPETATRFVSGLTFVPNDAVHMRQTGGFGPYLAAQLCALEARAGKRAACASVAGGNDG
jgi:hypothetical protein